MNNAGQVVWVYRTTGGRGEYAEVNASDKDRSAKKRPTMEVERGQERRKGAFLVCCYALVYPSTLENFFFDLFSRPCVLLSRCLDNPGG